MQVGVGVGVGHSCVFVSPFFLFLPLFYVVTFLFCCVRDWNKNDEFEFGVGGCISVEA